MDTDIILNLLKEGGVATLFIAFLIWLIKYFMQQLEHWRDNILIEQKSQTELITSHLEKACVTITKLEGAINTLISNLDLLDQIMKRRKDC